MTQSISEFFQRALLHLLGKEGRGAQSRLARQQGIDRGYLNAIVKGRKAGAEAIRVKIATHFNMTYEEMIALGRKISQEKGDLSSEELKEKKIELPVSSGTEPVIDREELFHNTLNATEKQGKQGGTDDKLADIIHSDTGYGEILVGLIDVFHETVSIKQDNQVLKNRISELEARLENLEKIVRR